MHTFIEAVKFHPYSGMEVPVFSSSLIHKLQWRSIWDLVIIDTLTRCPNIPGSRITGLIVVSNIQSLTCTSLIGSELSLLAVSLTPLSVEGEGESDITLDVPVVRELTEGGRTAWTDGKEERLSLVGLHVSLKTGVIQLAQHGSPSLAYIFVKRLNFCK